jgi:hypothetical protein
MVPRPKRSVEADTTCDQPSGTQPVIQVRREDPTVWRRVAHPDHELIEPPSFRVVPCARAQLIGDDRRQPDASAAKVALKSRPLLGIADDLDEYRRVWHLRARPNADCQAVTPRRHVLISTP